MTTHFEILVEEPSMEAFLRGVLPRLLPKDRTFAIHPSQGKPDLLAKLEARLRGYAAWLPRDWRIVVVVDRDDDDCRELKQRMEQITTAVGLRSRTQSPSCWQLVNRIVIEELEAWYFGDWDAVVHAYEKLPRTLPPKYRHSDAIAGGTWEALEKILQRHGYFKSGLRKIEVARTIAGHFDPEKCRSRSFQCFHKAILEAVEKNCRE
ncbi:MAG TPA: DUF4276 family protein [Sedimentisphaerales bacterium]|nr:DUF4276 family protein [Methanothrix sp.]HON93839.1 DUF4276 family protein [Sedimentisphaerales bacterium]